MDDGAAGGGDYDACECVWSHEMATRRIINMIRQTQDYCTENECITDGNAPGANGNGAGGDNMAMFFIGFWFVLALILYLMRPKRNADPGKGHDAAGPSFDPPAPTAS